MGAASLGEPTAQRALVRVEHRIDCRFGPVLRRAPVVGYDRTAFYRFRVFRTPVRVPFGMAQKEPKGHLGLCPKNPTALGGRVKGIAKLSCLADFVSPSGTLD